MLIKIMEVLKPKDDLKNVHKGIVVKNNDPLKLGRVKAIVRGLFEDSTNDYERLPWITCLNNIEMGNDKGSINPPVIGSKIKVMWLDDSDIYTPYYNGYWLDKSNSPTIVNGFDEQAKNNYPNVYFKQDNKGNYEIVNKIQGFSEKGYEGGVKYKVDKNKDVSLKEVHNYLLETENTNIKASNEINLESNIIKAGVKANVKALVTEQHLDKYNTLIDDITNLIVNPLVGALNTLASGVLTPIQLAWQTKAELDKDNSNKTNNLKGS